MLDKIEEKVKHFIDASKEIDELYVTTIMKLTEFYQFCSGKGGATCPAVKKHYDDSFNNIKFYHCRRCRFEICPACVEKVQVF